MSCSGIRIWQGCSPDTSEQELCRWRRLEHPVLTRPMIPQHARADNSTPKCRCVRLAQSARANNALLLAVISAGFRHSPRAHRNSRTMLDKLLKWLRSPTGVLGAFVHLIFTDWWSGMSGAFSIPFVFLGAVNVRSQKDLFYILAIASLIITLYRTWCRQRRIILDLEDRLRPL